ncbi:hypothetical protein NQ317_004218 [Molorchus minor]|uniref:Uncharacterized protein n=1 Tax=Molorchus minor TaxID=1323400 RepID=A0ABQ9JKY6_9CUCU|nr:hypothetical protein NQ317_004218 [Molorchus minor]
MIYLSTSRTWHPKEFSVPAVPATSIPSPYSKIEIHLLLQQNQYLPSEPVGYAAQGKMLKCPLLELHTNFFPGFELAILM